MKYFSMVVLLTFFLGACTSVLTPRINEATDSTIEQRCVDYVTTLETLKLIAQDRTLNDREQALYNIATAFVSANCL